MHLPNGRSTRIRDAVVIDSARCQRRVSGMLEQSYARSEHWPRLSTMFAHVVDLIEKTDRLHQIAELSTRILLDAFGWTGSVVRSSDLNARTDRSDRLADLTRAVGADTYICGRGGARYLEPAAFDRLGLTVDYFSQPTWIAPRIWDASQSVSAAWTLAKYGDLRSVAPSRLGYSTA